MNGLVNRDHPKFLLEEGPAGLVKEQQQCHLVLLWLQNADHRNTPGTQEMLSSSSSSNSSTTDTFHPNPAGRKQPQKMGTQEKELQGTLPQHTQQTQQVHVKFK